ncbi:MAG: (d)CMP kinase [Candidatus Electryonea clarkiae]|nr:(d)CMP kinase [Candidatus Electryonea clarkiae]MDP8285280.1 (d)CMP kinase [Candidatus Electryonea clarkiae]
MNNLLKVIAIDGPAASGKSTTARGVARQLGWRYIDTGAMYRVLGLAALRKSVDPNNIDKVRPILEDVDIELSTNEPMQVFLNGEDVSEEIRTPEASEAASQISVLSEVRIKLVEIQRKLGVSGQAVLEGRDTGTVVFPDAGLKIFLDAELEERVQRRVYDYRQKGIDKDHNEVRAELSKRDKRDSERDDSPLTISPDAVIIDTTAMTIDNQIEEVMRRAREIFQLAEKE